MFSCFTQTSSAETKNILLPELNNPKCTIASDADGPTYLAKKKYFPEAKEFFTDLYNASVAVQQSKINAGIYEKSFIQFAINNGLKGIKILPYTFDEKINVVAAISRKTNIKNLREDFNKFIAELKINNEINNSLEEWLNNPNRILNNFKAPENPKLKLIIGTTGLVAPYSFYIGNNLTGFDVELAYKFAEWCNADIEFKTYNFEGLITALVTGEIDIALSNLYATPERAEVSDFSDVLYNAELCIFVHDDDKNIIDANNNNAEFNSISELDGKKIGLFATSETYIEDVKKILPASTIFYFNATADLIEALNGKKIDAFVIDEPVVKQILKEHPELDFIPENFGKSYEVAYVMPKNDNGVNLKNQIDKFIISLRESGELEKILKIWNDDDENIRILPDYKNFNSQNGIIKLAVNAEMYPFSYYRNNEVVGIESCLIARFCEANNYGLQITPINIDSIIFRSNW